MFTRASWRSTTDGLVRERGGPEGRDGTEGSIPGMRYELCSEAQKQIVEGKSWRENPGFKSIRFGDTYQKSLARTLVRREPPLSKTNGAEEC